MPTPGGSTDLVSDDLESMSHQLAGELPALEGRRVVISGGAGFLGFYLVRALLHWNDAGARERIDVSVLDNFSRGAPRWLADLAGRDDLHVFEHDVTDALPEGFGPHHYVVHAASIASPVHYRRHPIETMDANVGGLRRLLDWSLAARETLDPVEGLLFFSSSEIYGDATPDAIPTPETYPGRVSCTGPRACYDESKRYGETLCVNFVRAHGLPVKIARPFNNYGPGLALSDGRALPDFVRNVLAGEDVALLSDGSPTRTFCYVADAVVGYLKVLVRGRPGEAYNIGSEAPEVSVRGLAELVVELARELWGYAGRARCARSEDRDYLVDNPQRRCPLIRKARQELGYQPSVELREGVRRSLLWYREHAEGAER